MSTHISDLREHLMQTLESLRNRSNPMEPDRARAIATVAGVLVDTARVEVEYIRATDQDTSNFIDSLKTPKAQAAIKNAPTGNVDRSTPGVTRHTMGDE